MAKTKRLTPADVVIAELGVRPLARDLNVSPGCIVRWRTRGGTIPQFYWLRLIELADGRITTEDLVYGR